MLPAAPPSAWHAGTSGTRTPETQAASDRRPQRRVPGLRSAHTRLVLLSGLLLMQASLLGAVCLLGFAPVQADVPSAAAGGPSAAAGGPAVALAAWAAWVSAVAALWMLLRLRHEAGTLVLQAAHGRRALRLLARRTHERDLALREHAGLAEHARRDDLTGLANRAAFMAALGDAVAASRCTGPPLTVMFIDLDDFKQVNDHHGHAAGDALLHAFAGRLQAGIRTSDLAARIGGDEFAVMAQGLDAASAAAMAASLTERLSQPYSLGELSVQASASIGLASCPDHGMDARTLLSAADLAMYSAKARGKSGFTTAAGAGLGRGSLAGGREARA
jgi:diguanylate cyclase (GGDEF)-like protein